MLLTAILDFFFFLDSVSWIHDDCRMSMTNEGNNDNFSLSFAVWPNYCGEVINEWPPFLALPHKSIYSKSINGLQADSHPLPHLENSLKLCILRFYVPQVRPATRLSVSPLNDSVPSVFLTSHRSSNLGFKLSWVLTQRFFVSRISMSCVYTIRFCCTRTSFLHYVWYAHFCSQRRNEGSFNWFFFGVLFSLRNWFRS